MKWGNAKLGDILFYEQPTRYIVASDEYNNSFTTPVLTAGKTFVLGYTNERQGIYTNLPAIIFDDFTTESKFVNFPFKVKSSAIKILTCSPSIADIRYMFHLLKNLKVLTGQHKRYWISKFANIEVPLPPLPIQRQIAGTLDKVDALRQKDQQLFEKYDQLSEAIFYDMFGDPVKNEKQWEMKTVRNVIENIQAGTSLAGEDRISNKGEIAVLKISSVTSGYFRHKEYKVPDQKLVPANPIVVNKGDLIFSRANTRELVGAVAIVQESNPLLMLPDKLWKIILNKKLINAEYCWNLLWDNHIRYELTKNATGTSGSMLNISMEKFKSLMIPVPPLNLQKKFADIFNSCVLQKKKLEKARIRTEKIYETLVTTYFS